MFIKPSFFILRPFQTWAIVEVCIFKAILKELGKKTSQQMESQLDMKQYYCIFLRVVSSIVVHAPCSITVAIRSFVHPEFH